MSLSSKPLESLDESDLQALVDIGAPEGKTLPGNTYEDKKEFLADVSSFANASGGHIVFGMKEQEGVAVELCGLGTINADAGILRLENLMRDGIEPRISGAALRAIPLHTPGEPLSSVFPEVGHNHM